MKRSILNCVLLVFGLRACIEPVHAAPGTVYLVLGSDTAVWNVSNGVDVTRYHNHFESALYTQPEGNAYKVMDPAFRNRFVDSFGQPLKLTWWMLVGSVYRQADNTDVPLANLMPLYLMKKYHGAAIQQLGDEISLHYHTFFWSDYNGDGVFFWNQARTFHECRQDFDCTLAQTLVEEEVFPVSFRSGWHYMDNEWQQYLNLLLPYSLHNYSPNVRTDTVEPFDNVYDWSKASTRFVPFHPSPTNYQTSGAGPGWNVRSVKFPNVTQATMDGIFTRAAAGTDQVACFWAHLPETDFLTNIAHVDLLAHVAASNHPTAQFRYCTAVEAMQRWRRLTNAVAPNLDVVEDVAADRLTLSLRTDESIFQPQPFVAFKDVFGEYGLASPTPDGTNSWKVTLPVPRSRLAKVGVAATDTAGNLATRIIRYLPDDLYLDNLDPQYAEVSGDWQQTTNAAWGIDARTALLGSNDTAQVRWTLPVSSSRRYSIFVQVPAVTNAARAVSFKVFSGGSNVASAAWLTPLPPHRWLLLATAFLDQTRENLLEMTVRGAGQPDTLAVADVIKVTALESLPDITSPHLVGNTFTFAAPTVNGLNYVLEAKDALGDSAWTHLQTLTGDGSTVTFTDSSAPPQGRFYRLRVE